MGKMDVGMVVCVGLEGIWVKEWYVGMVGWRDSLDGTMDRWTGGFADGLK